MAAVDAGSSVTKRRPHLGPRLSQVNIGIWRALVGFVLLGMWALSAKFVGDNFIPTPFETAKAAVQIFSDGAVPAAILSTMVVFVGGYVLASFVAIPMGLLMGGFRVFGAALEPYVDALSAMPRVS